MIFQHELTFNIVIHEESYRPAAVTAAGSHTGVLSNTLGYAREISEPHIWGLHFIQQYIIFSTLITRNNFQWFSENWAICSWKIPIKAFRNLWGVANAAIENVKVRDYLDQSKQYLPNLPGTVSGIAESQRLNWLSGWETKSTGCGGLLGLDNLSV
jgi:hypothetical protein